MNQEERSTGEEDSLGYDVFIAHSAEDNNFVHNDLKQKLDEKGIKVLTDADDFTPGRPVLENINQAIKCSKKTLIVISENSLKSPWCSLEMLLAFEKSQRKNKLSVVLLIKNETETVLPAVEMFAIAPKILMKSDNVTPDILDKIVEELKRDVPIEHLLPAGNLAHGLVWSHFTGLLQYLLPKLDDLIEQTSIYKENPGRFPKKLYELIPESCRLEDKVTDTTGRIAFAGHLPPFEYYRAGNRREVEMSIYKIQDEDGNVFYCVAEYPSALGAVSKMEDNHLAKVTKEDRRLQVGRFYYTMQSILSHPSFESCQEKAKLLLYNEKKKKASDVLLSEIKTDLRLQKSSPRLEHPMDRLQSVDREYEFDVYISYYAEETDPKSFQVYEAINDKLRHEGFKVLEAAASLSDRQIANCRWVILILTRRALHCEKFSLTVMSILSDCVEDKKVRVLPVIAGENMRDTDIPESLKWVTYVDATHNEKYLESLCLTLRGADIPFHVETHLPAGNVAYGFAWAYVLNYLEFVLKGNFPNLIEEKLKEKTLPKHVCPLKLYVIIPQSCSCKDKLSEVDSSICLFESLKTIYKDQSGVKDRQYICNMYQIKKENDMDLFFVGQHAAPVLCMYEMSEKKIAGMQKHDMEEQAIQFYEEVQQILESSLTAEYSNRCELVWHNDAQMPLSDEMSRRILTWCQSQSSMEMS